MRLSTDGLIVKESNVGEYDRLVVALTRHRGLITAFAPGARRLKNRNASSTGLLCYSNLTFFRGKDTYKVDEASAIEVFFPLRSDIVKLSLAQYFCELCLCLAPEGAPAEDFLRLTLNSLHFLSKDGRPPLLLKSVMELRMLTLSGYMPDLLACIWTPSAAAFSAKIAGGRRRERPFCPLQKACWRGSAIYVMRISINYFLFPCRRRGSGP